VAREKVQKKEKTSHLLRQDLAEVRQQIFADPIIEQVAAIARQKKVPLYLVGGAIRDLLLGRQVNDYDFVLKKIKMPFLNQLRDRMGASLFPMGKEKQERVYRLLKDDKTVDLAALAGDGIVQDLQRRDFTINAIAYAFDQGRFYCDPHAIGDIKAGRITLVSPHALQTDPLRMLRAIRYRCTLSNFDMTAHRRILHRSVVRGTQPV
jgi:tRNA nucleotidyltransferase/poly(A) polymerase